MQKAAIFLDRDGTIIDDTGYIDDPGRVRLLPKSADAIRTLRKAGFLVVIVSNQSGVARGLFDENTLSKVHERMEALLLEEGAALDGAYYCPYLTGADAKVEAYRKSSDLRKPEPGMLYAAAADHDVDLAASWMIGDSLRDVEAGTRAGCRTILIDSKNQHRDGNGEVVPTHVARNLAEAAKFVQLAAGACVDTQPQATAVKQDAPNDSGEVTRLLAQISDQLDRAQRSDRQHDFSVLRLFGAVLQMFAVVAAVWGAMALFNNGADVDATPRLMLACFLQLATLCAYAIDRFR